VHSAQASRSARPTRSEREHELESLLRSGVVREGTLGHAILVYLAGRALDDGIEPPKEYTIGVEALHKPHSYDPRIDATVRVEVGRLRGRLREHYQSEGASHPVRLEIPKGGYAAEFVRVPAVSASASALWRSTAVLLGLLLVAGGVFLLRRQASPAFGVSPSVKGFWSPFLDGRPVLLVYGAPLFVKVDRSFFRDPHVNTPEEISTSDHVSRLLAALRPEEQRPVYHFTGFGEAESMARITRLLAGAGAAVEIRRSSLVSWDEMKRDHVILLGGRKFNIQIPALPHPFKYESVPRRIVNRLPAPGEVLEYVTQSREPHGELLEEYALISSYPGLGTGTRLLILDSSSSEGTAAAGEFLTRDDSLADLAGRLGRSTTRPCQIIVKAKLRNGVPISVEYVTHAWLD